MADSPESHLETLQTYYTSLDTKDFDIVRSLLADEFTQYRSDRTFENPEQFLSFMANDRPQPDTTHEITALFTPAESDPAADLVAARGTVWSNTGDRIFDFVDIATLTVDSKIRRLETYTR